MQSSEDIGVNNIAQRAVGSNQTDINDATLAACLGASPAAGLKQKIGLNFKCNNLPNLDVKSKTDAFIVLWDISNVHRGVHKSRVGYTEIVADSLNPEFVTEIEVDYYFEMQQVFLV